MRSLRARLDRLERRLAQRGERDYQHEVELFSRSVGGDKKAFEEWTAIVIADRSDERPAPFFFWLHQGVAINFAYRANDERK